MAKVWFFFQKNRKDTTLEQVCSTVNLSPAFTTYEPGESVLGLTFLICKIPAILPLQGPTRSSGGLRREHVMEASQIRAPALLQFWPVGEERRAVPASVTYAMVRHCAGSCFLGNLKPLQREGFNWLRLCAFSKAASQAEISPQEGQTPQRPESWKLPPICLSLLSYLPFSLTGVGMAWKEPPPFFFSSHPTSAREGCCIRASS